MFVRCWVKRVNRMLNSESGMFIFSIQEKRTGAGQKKCKKSPRLAHQSKMKTTAVCPKD